MRMLVSMTAFTDATRLAVNPRIREGRCVSISRFPAQPRTLLPIVSRRTQPLRGGQATSCSDIICRIRGVRAEYTKLT
jgi:hypothetical protein